MINSKFLRRIERNPLYLKERNDLIFFQFDAPLEPMVWAQLTYPDNELTFAEFFRKHCQEIRNDEDNLPDIPFFYPDQLFNADIYFLCLIQRVRKELKVNPLIIQESDFVEYCARMYSTIKPPVKEILSGLISI